MNAPHIYCGRPGVLQVEIWTTPLAYEHHIVSLLSSRTPLSPYCSDDFVGILFLIRRKLSSCAPSSTFGCVFPSLFLQKNQFNSDSNAVLVQLWLIPVWNWWSTSGPNAEKGQLRSKSKSDSQLIPMQKRSNSDSFAEKKTTLIPMQQLSNSDSNAEKSNSDSNAELSNSDPNPEIIHLWFQCRNYPTLIPMQKKSNSDSNAEKIQLGFQCESNQLWFQ